MKYERLLLRLLKLVAYVFCSGFRLKWSNEIFVYASLARKNRHFLSPTLGYYFFCEGVHQNHWDVHFLWWLIRQRNLRNIEFGSQITYVLKVKARIRVFFTTHELDPIKNTNCSTISNSEQSGINRFLNKYFGIDQLTSIQWKLFMLGVQHTKNHTVRGCWLRVQVPKDNYVSFVKDL